MREVFPLELRDVCIILFYATGTPVRDVAAPVLLGRRIESGSRTPHAHRARRVMWNFTRSTLSR